MVEIQNMIPLAVTGVRCGYMATPATYQTRGIWKNTTSAAIANGTIMKMNDQGKLALASAEDVFRCIEKTYIYDGIPAYLVKTVDDTKELYLVQNEIDFNDSFAYDGTEYTTAVGEYLKVYPLNANDELFVAFYGDDSHNHMSVGALVDVSNGVIGVAVAGTM